MQNDCSNIQEFCSRMKGPCSDTAEGEIVILYIVTFFTLSIALLYVVYFLRLCNKVFNNVVG